MRDLVRVRRSPSGPKLPLGISILQMAQVSKPANGHISIPAGLSAVDPGAPILAEHSFALPGDLNRKRIGLWIQSAVSFLGFEGSTNNRLGQAALQLASSKVENKLTPLAVKTDWYGSGTLGSLLGTLSITYLVAPGEPRVVGARGPLRVALTAGAPDLACSVSDASLVVQILYGDPVAFGV